MDRAMLILNGTSVTSDLLLWQNAEECHHCSWVRSRDRAGDKLPVLKENVTFIAWVDSRWRMRFRLAKESSTNTDYQGGSFRQC